MCVSYSYRATAGGRMNDANSIVYYESSVSIYSVIRPIIMDTMLNVFSASYRIKTHLSCTYSFTHIYKR